MALKDQHGALGQLNEFVMQLSVQELGAVDACALPFVGASHVDEAKWLFFIQFALQRAHAERLDLRWLGRVVELERGTLARLDVIDDEPLGARRAQAIEGDPNAVLGLSLRAVREMLEGTGISLTKLWQSAT